MECAVVYHVSLRVWGTDNQGAVLYGMAKSMGDGHRDNMRETYAEWDSIDFDPAFSAEEYAPCHYGGVAARRQRRRSLEHGCHTTVTVTCARHAISHFCYTVNRVMRSQDELLTRQVRLM